MEISDLIKNKLIIKADVVTTAGKIDLVLDAYRAPKTVERFIMLATSDFYVDTVFHRIIKDFIIQGGGHDINNPRQEKAECKQLGGIRNESFNGLTNCPGTIGIARNAVPDSARCQFYFNMTDNWGSNAGNGFPGYTVFGYVTGGMDVVHKISHMPTSEASIPQEDSLVTIKSVNIDKEFLESEEYKTYLEMVEANEKDNQLHENIYEDFLASNEGIDHSSEIPKSFGSSFNGNPEEVINDNSKLVQAKAKTQEKIIQQNKKEDNSSEDSKEKSLEEATNTAEEMLQKFTKGKVEKKEEKEEFQEI